MTLSAACICHLIEFLLIFFYWGLFTNVSPGIPASAGGIAVIKCLFGLTRITIIQSRQNPERTCIYVSSASIHLILSIFTTIFFIGLIWLVVAQNLGLAAIIMTAPIGIINIIGFGLISIDWLNFYRKRNISNEIPNTTPDQTGQQTGTNHIQDAHFTGRALQRNAKSISPSPRESVEICSICREGITINIVNLVCAHYFHGACIKEWWEHQSLQKVWNTCPNCRTRAYTENIDN